MFPHLSLPWNISLSILVGLAGLYLILLFMAIGFMMFFKRSLARNSKALLVVMATKLENIKKLIVLIEKFNDPLSNEIHAKVDSIDLNGFKNPSSEFCKDVSYKLTYLTNELEYYCRVNEILTKHQEVKLAKQAASEMDSNYRMIVANYNADVLGYNYWIKFLPARWLFKLFKQKIKDTL